MSETDELVTLAAIDAAQAVVLTNLFELYAYDFSEHVALELKPNGRFDVPLDAGWWSDARHFPFFVHHGGRLAGFALLRRGSRVGGDPEAMDVAEFFVVRGARRRGVGRAAAHALFGRFPGRWEIRVRSTNLGAKRFWSSAVQGSLGRPAERRAFSAKGVEWEVLAFDSMTPTTSQDR